MHANIPLVLVLVAAFGGFGLGVLAGWRFCWSRVLSESVRVEGRDARRIMLDAGRWPWSYGVVELYDDVGLDRAKL